MSITNEEVKNIFISNENHFKIDNTGNIGIGTTTPTSLLDIRGSGDRVFKMNRGDNSTFTIRNDGHAYTYLNSYNSALLCLGSSNGTGDSTGSTVNHMCITPDGRIGLLSNQPIGAHLVINTPAYANGDFGVWTTGFLGSGYIQNNGNSNPSLGSNKASGNAWEKLSLKMTKGMYTQGDIVMASDKRIKTDISLINDDTALNKVNSLESYEYNYIDPMRKRPMKTIGFIAQEVKEVIPNAVSLQPDWVPDEIRRITNPNWAETDAGKWQLTIPDLDMSGNFTGKVKFYVSNDPIGNDEVCKEVEVESNNKSFIFDKTWNNVFLWGKEVNDFHTLDKNMIFALHHSAIQELSKRNDAKDKRITELEDEIKKIKEHIGMG